MQQADVIMKQHFYAVIIQILDVSVLVRDVHIIEDVRINLMLETCLNQVVTEMFRAAKRCDRVEYKTQRVVRSSAVVMQFRYLFIITVLDDVAIDDVPFR